MISPISLPFISLLKKSRIATAEANTTSPMARLVRPTRNNSRNRRRCPRARCRKNSWMGVPQHRRLVREARRTVEVHHKRQPRLTTNVLRPRDDELLGFGVQVSAARG